MISREVVVGLLALGAFVNVLLYGLELVLLYMYVRNSKTSKRSNIIFTINFLSDTICSVAVCVATYLYMMAKRGDITLSHQGRWPETIILVTTTISIYTMHSESVHRYWSMSRKLEAVHQASPSRISITPSCTNILVTIGVASSALVSLAGLIYSLVGFGHNKRSSRFLILWLTGITVAYATLAPGLIWRSCRITDQHQRIWYQLLTIATGSDIPTGVIAVVTLILSATTESSVAMAFISILGRVSTCTGLLALIFCKTDQEQSTILETSTIGTEEPPSNAISGVLGMVGPTVDGAGHDIELGSLSDGSSIFSHASFLSEVEIDRRVLEFEVAAREVQEVGNA